MKRSIQFNSSFYVFPLDDSNAIHEFIWHLLSLIEHISLFSSYSGSELNFYFRCLYKCFENRNSSLLPLYCPHTLSVWITALLIECSLLLSLSHQSEKNQNLVYFSFMHHLWKKQNLKYLLIDCVMWNITVVVLLLWQPKDIIKTDFVGGSNIFY